MSRRAERAGVVASAVLLGIVACASSPAPQPSSTDAPSATNVAWEQWRPSTSVRLPQLSAAESSSLRDAWLASMASYVDIDPSTLPGLVRWVSPDEVPQVIAACLRDKGWPATAEPDSSISINGVSDSQARAFDVASLECDAMYSVDPRFLRPDPVVTAEILWEYNDTFLIPCLRERGYEPDEPLPTKEVFAQRTTPWYAHPEAGLGVAEHNALKAACPVAPPAAALTG